MYRPPAQIGDSIDQIDTPALILDLNTFEFNLAQLNESLKDFPNVKVRCHAKAHKCPAIALRQIEAGAVGICCQKVSEAEIMAQAGLRDVFVSNEVVGKQKLRRLCALTQLGTKVSIAVDSKFHVTELLDVCKETNCHVDVLVEVDVGGNRCGVPPEAAADLVAFVHAQDSSLISFKGLHCYHGGNQHIREYSDRQRAVEEVCRKVKIVLDDLDRRQLPKPSVVTGAGTGTYPFEVSSGIYTEIQPGSYVFMDVDYGRNKDESGAAFSRFKQSLFVLSTVMSDWRDRGRVVVDAGLKAFALDSGAPQLYRAPGDSCAPITGIDYVAAGDEHGKLLLTKSAPADAIESLQLGKKVFLAPDHCDPTVNLYDWIVVLRDGHVVALWPISARGPGN